MNALIKNTTECMSYFVEIGSLYEALGYDSEQAKAAKAIFAAAPHGAGYTALERHINSNDSDGVSVEFMQYAPSVCIQIDDANYQVRVQGQAWVGFYEAGLWQDDNAHEAIDSIESGQCGMWGEYAAYERHYEIFNNQTVTDEIIAHKGYSGRVTIKN